MSKPTITLKQTINPIEIDNDNDNKIETSDLLPFQRKIYSKFQKILGSLAKECEAELSSYICYTFQTQQDQSKFKTQYMLKGVNLCRNLDPEGSLQNDYLLTHVKSGEITPYQLVRLSDQELYPPKWKEISDRHMKDISTLDHENKVVTEGLYTCGKCKMNKCSYYQLQTRSCDEPTTTFINCLNCGNTWRD
jgi:transcription elongation factor S-II